SSAEKPAGDRRPPAQRDRKAAGLTGAVINRRAADRLRQGHVWVYASDVENVDESQNARSWLLPVADSRGMLLGTALYSPSSQIALRLIARDAIGDEEWLQLL